MVSAVLEKGGMTQFPVLSVPQCFHWQTAASTSTSSGAVRVSAGREQSHDINYGLGLIEFCQRRSPAPAHPPTQNSYRWYSVPPYMVVGAAGFEPATS